MGRSQRAFVLVVVGILIAMCYRPIYEAIVHAFPVDQRIEILKSDRYGTYEVIPFFFGLLLLLVGTFLALFGKKHGLVMGAGGWAKRLCGFLPPAKLIVALCMFFLPWIDVQCRYKMRNGDSGNTVILRQSGLQIATGGYEDKGATNPFVEPGKKQEALTKRPDAAPLVALYGVAIAFGAAAGLTVRSRWIRFATLATCSLAACCLLLLQSQRGFPLAASVAIENGHLQANPMYLKPDSLTVGPPELTVQLTWWYYAALIFPAAAALTAVIDFAANRVRSACEAPETIPRTTAPPNN
jgi:hypothetical protein